MTNSNQKPNTERNKQQAIRASLAILAFTILSVVLYWIANQITDTIFNTLALLAVGIVSSVALMIYLTNLLSVDVEEGETTDAEQG